jgi:hypothetical protein
MAKSSRRGVVHRQDDAPAGRESHGLASSLSGRSGLRLLDQSAPASIVGPLSSAPAVAIRPCWCSGVLALLTGS